MRPLFSSLCATLLVGSLLLVGCDGSPGALEPDTPAVERAPSRAPVATASVPLSLLLPLVQTQVRGAEVVLNNYGPRTTGTWHRPDDARLRIAGLGVEDVTFNIPESRIRLGPFRLYYYVQDLRVIADSIEITADETLAEVLPVGTPAQPLRLTLRFPFEDEGAEFKGRCLSQTVFGTGPCFGSTDSAAPDIEFDDGALVITLETTVRPDSLLGLQAVGARLEGTVQAGGVCNLNLGGRSVDLCDRLVSYKQQIRLALETTALTALNASDVQDGLATSLGSLLASVGIGPVVEARYGEGALIVQHVPRTASDQ